MDDLGVILSLPQNEIKRRFEEPLLKKVSLNGESFWVEIYELTTFGTLNCICKNNLINLPIQSGDKITLIRSCLINDTLDDYEVNND